MNDPGPDSLGADARRMVAEAQAREMSVTYLSSAIDRVTQYRNLPLGEQLSHAVGFASAEREAWKAAYVWRVNFTERWRKEDVLVRERDHLTWEAEERYGTALVSEILNK